MSCDPTRERLNAGAPLDADTLEHVKTCPACRDEFAHVLALRSSRPQPSPALRERVLAAAPRRAFPWSIAAAAAVIVALMVGYAAGRATAPIETKIVKETVEKTVIKEVPVDRIVEVIKAEPVRQTQLAALAIALSTVYQDSVQCRWQGHSCKTISACKSIAERYPMCPLVREMKALEKTNPELVSFH